MNFKNLLTVATLLCFCAFTNTAIAQTWDIGNPGYNPNVKATLSGNTLRISGNGYMCDFWDSTEGEAPWWFNADQRNAITTVVIQSSVMNIGNRAFHDCSNLREITIENTVTIIGRQAFFNCTNLQSITVPNSVTEIEGEAFKNCTSLKNVTIDEGSTNLNFTGYRYPDNYSGSYYYGWFENCPIQTLNLRRQYTYAGGTLFSGNNNLQTLIVGRNVTSIGSSAFADCSGLINVTLEDGSQDLIFGSLGDAETVFSGCPINTLSLGRKIYTMSGWRATSFSASLKSPFYNKTTLTTLTVGNSISITAYSFQNCINMKTVSIGNSVTSIEEYSFDGCSSLSNVTIGNSVTSIDNAAFRNCTALKSISIPNNVTSLGSSAFSGSGLTSVTIPNNITNIGSSSFADCSGLTNVTLEDGSQDLIFGSLGDAETVFSGCPINTLSLGRKIYTMSGWRATSFSASLKSPFYNKTTLKTLTVGSNVTSITDYTFDGCSGLTQITSNNPAPPTIYTNTFNGVSKSITVKVPCGSLNAYRTAQYWSTFTNMNDGGYTTGIADITTEKIQIYPNPVRDELFIQTELPINKVEIYDISGCNVETWHAASLRQNDIQTINVSALQKGIYTLKIYTDTDAIIKKVMKK